MQKEKVIPIVTLILSLAGLGISYYLSLKHATGTEITNCPIFGGGCVDVLNSKYSAFLGIPLAYYGMAFYSGMAIISALFISTKNKIFLSLLALGAIVGFIDSLVFVYIQAVLIGAFCFYCLMSAVTATLLFITMLGTIIDKLLDFFEK